LSVRMSRLCLVAGLVLALTAITGASIIREKRDACEEINEGFNNCNMEAYAEYKKAFDAGDDGRPDWMARKACNYMTAAVEECGNKLIGDCNTEEDVTNMKDEQLRIIIGQLETSVEEWDSEKCPPVQAYADRMKRDEDAGEDEETDGEEDVVADGVEAEEDATADDNEADSEIADVLEVDAEDADAADADTDAATIDDKTEEIEEAAEGVEDVDDPSDDGLVEETEDDTESEDAEETENEVNVGDDVEVEEGEEAVTKETEVEEGDPQDDNVEDEQSTEIEDGDENGDDDDESSAKSITASLSIMLIISMVL